MSDDYADEALRWLAKMPDTEAIMDRVLLLKNENARIRAENERLRQDAERYRWLRGHGSCPWAETDDVWVLPEDMDAAIDAAMKQESER